MKGYAKRRGIKVRPTIYLEELTTHIL
jgi:hypothetical protein